MQVQNNFLQYNPQNKYSIFEKNTPNLGSLINFGNITKVSYAVIDGNMVTNTETIKDIISQFIKQLNKFNPKDNMLRKNLATTTKDYCSLIKKIGNYIITGSDAAKLETIWSQARVSNMTKRIEASNFIKKLLQNTDNNKIMLMGTSKKAKDKVKYDITDVFTTIY